MAIKEKNKAQGLMNYQHLIELLQKNLEGYYPELRREPANLYDPLSYILSLGGKRLRPLLSLISCDLFDKDPQGAIPSALAVELFHNFSLIHDDIMDRAPLRRGKATVHEKWNSTIAILSGDAMLVKAYESLAKNKSEHLPAMLKLFNTTALEVCEGQQFDMDFESNREIKVSDYLSMITLKTAVLLGCSLKMGAIAADASESDSEHLYEFGKQMGIAFQLKDDILDVYGDPEKTGKQVGGDIISNKKTFLLLSAMDLSVTHQKNELSRWLAMPEFDSLQKVNAVKEIYDQLDIKQVAENEANRHFQSGIERLNKVSAASEKKEKLLRFSQDLIARES